MSPVSLIFHIKSTVNSCPQLLSVEWELLGISFWVACSYLTFTSHNTIA